MTEDSPDDHGARFALGILKIGTMRAADTAVTVEFRAFDAADDEHVDARARAVVLLEASECSHAR
jgi:hypothetical protein